MSDDQFLQKNQQNTADSNQLQESKNQEGSSSLSSAQYPVSGPLKEHAPLETPSVEYIKPTEVEPTLHPEVKEAGVEISPNLDRPPLTDEHQRLGIENAKESIPVSVSQTPSAQLPYTQEQIEMLKKNTSKDDSKHWLVILIEYLSKKLSLNNSNQIQNQEMREV